MTAKEVEKHKGGRGKKSDNKYDRFTATLSPENMQLLDTHAQARGISRSEMLARMVEHYGKARPVKLKSDMTGKDG
jgi:predicted transcriptional regulator